MFIFIFCFSYLVLILLKNIGNLTLFKKFISESSSPLSKKSFVMKHQQKFDWFSCWLISLAPLANTRMEGFCFIKECFITIDWPFKYWIIFVIFWFPLKSFFRMFNSLKCEIKTSSCHLKRGGRGKPTTLTKSPTPYFFFMKGGRGIACLKKFSLVWVLFYFYKNYYIFLLLLIRVRKFYF